MGLRVLITGTTGFIGGGIFKECLDNEDFDSIVSVRRSSVNVTSPKFEEIILPDLTYLSGIEDKLTDFDACFFV